MSIMTKLRLSTYPGFTSLIGGVDTAEDVHGLLDEVLLYQFKLDQHIEFYESEENPDKVPIYIDLEMVDRLYFIHRDCDNKTKKVRMLGRMHHVKRGLVFFSLDVKFIYKDNSPSVRKGVFYCTKNPKNFASAMYLLVTEEHYTILREQIGKAIYKDYYDVTSKKYNLPDI